METDKSDQTHKPKYNLKEAWQDLKIALGLGAAIGGAYVVGDLWPDDSLDGHCVWDTREWRDFWDDASKSSSDTSFPNLDGWLSE